MRRGEIFLVRKPGSQDPRRQRAFVIVSRQALIDTKFSSVICAPVYSRHDGLSTQVRIRIEGGLKRESSIHCDELVSLLKTMLTRYVGQLTEDQIEELNGALVAALDLQEGYGFSIPSSSAAGTRRPT
jgi:mRNA interferase MazF